MRWTTSKFSPLPQRRNNDFLGDSRDRNQPILSLPSPRVYFLSPQPERRPQPNGNGAPPRMTHHARRPQHVGLLHLVHEGAIQQRHGFQPIGAIQDLPSCYQANVARPATLVAAGGFSDRSLEKAPGRFRRVLAGGRLRDLWLGVLDLKAGKLLDSLRVALCRFGFGLGHCLGRLLHEAGGGIGTRCAGDGIDAHGTFLCWLFIGPRHQCPVMSKQRIDGRKLESNPTVADSGRPRPAAIASLPDFTAVSWPLFSRLVTLDDAVGEISF